MRKGSGIWKDIIRWTSVAPKLRAPNRSEIIAAFATRLRRVFQDKDGSNGLVYHTTSRTP